MGLDQTPVETRGPDKALPLITGAYGGHTIDFRDFAAQGVTLLGRLVAANDGVLEVGPTGPNPQRHAALQPTLRARTLGI